MSKGYVYLIGVVGHSVYKIGCSTDPARRIKVLQSAKNYKLEIVHTIYSTNYETLESRCQSMFSKCKLSNEWFLMTNEDVERFKGLGS